MSRIPYLDELGDALEHAVAKRPERRRFGALLAFGAGFLVVVAIGVSWWLLRPAPPGSADPAPNTTTAATVTAVTDPAEREFARIPDSAVLADGSYLFLSDVVVAGGEFVAVGSGESGGVVLTSTDGVTWFRVPGPGSGVSLDAAFVAGGDLVVGGMDAAFGPAAWRRTADGGWVRLPLPGSGFAVASVRDFAIVDGSLIVVGQGIAGEDRDAEVSALVWRQTGGSWERISGGSLGGVTEVDATGVDHGAGVTVASGVWSAAEGEHRAVVWVSEDAASWQRIELPLLDDTDRRSFATDVAWTGDRFAVTGGAWIGGSRVAVIWTSPDGTSWTAVDQNPALFAAESGELRLNTLALVDDGLLALGVGSDAAQGHPVLLSSTDGSTWDRTELADPGTLWIMAAGAAQLGDTVVLAGGDGAGGAVWVSPVPPGLVAAAPPPEELETPAAISLSADPEVASATTRVKVEVDLAGMARPDGPVSVVVVGDSFEREACTITMAAGYPPWCDFRPQDLGLTQPADLVIEARVGEEVIASSDFTTVDSGTSIVRLAVNFTPRTYPIVQRVSVRNQGDAMVDLSGWWLAPAGGDVAFTFPEGTIVEPGRSAGLLAGTDGALDCGEVAGNYLIACRPRGSDAIVGPDMESLAGGIVLFDGDGEEVDRWSPAEEG